MMVAMIWAVRSLKIDSVTPARAHPFPVLSGLIISHGAFEHAVKTLRMLEVAPHTREHRFLYAIGV